MTSRTMLGLLVVGLSALTGTAARAVSGNGFHPFTPADVPYINYAVGAVNNSDPVHYRGVTADLGEPGFSNGYYWKTVVSGTFAAPTSGLTCTLVARNIQTGNATWASATENTNGNFAFPVIVYLPVPGYYSFSVNCGLPQANASGPTTYIWTSGSPIACTTAGNC